MMHNAELSGSQFEIPRKFQTQIREFELQSTLCVQLLRKKGFLSQQVPKKDPRKMPMRVVFRTLDDITTF